MVVILDDARKAWLAGLKVGDKVYNTTRGGSVMEVKRFTNKFIVLTCGYTYEWRARKDNGMISGDYGHIEPLTQEAIAMLKRRRVEHWSVYEVQGVMRRLSTEQKEQLFDIVRNMVEANMVQKAKAV